MFRAKGINMMQKKLVNMDIYIYALLSTKTVKSPDIKNHDTQNHSSETQIG
jgi:hypothetical protein